MPCGLCFFCCGVIKSFTPLDKLRLISCCEIKQNPDMTFASSKSDCRKCVSDCVSFAAQNEMSLPKIIRSEWAAKRRLLQATTHCSHYIRILMMSFSLLSALSFLSFLYYIRHYSKQLASVKHGDVGRLMRSLMNFTLLP